MKIGISTVCTFAVLSVFVSLRSSVAQVVPPGQENVIEQPTIASSDTVDGENANSRCCDSPYGAAGLGCRPWWTVTAEALFLQRRSPAPALLMTAGPAQDLDASSFRFDFHPGVDVSLAFQADSDNTLEVRYLGIDQWQASTNTVTIPLTLLRINAAPPLFAFAGAAINADYVSELHNFEINGLHRMSDRWALLAGFRYAELDEHFQATLPGTLVTYDARTRNRLCGFQLGGTAALWDRGGPLTVSGVGKGGIYGNQAAQDSTFAFLPAPANDKATPVAFLGEIGLTADYRLGEHLSVLGGYRLLWINGVALATDQVAVSNFFTRSGINASGDAFYHGAFLGLESQW
ncbi:MAG: hypothetical protein NTY19_22390 [Planctomycetota bacterium]|nr:hypothetical protein [Planctomycetota bacterium]